MNFLKDNWQKFVVVFYSVFWPLVLFAADSPCKPGEGKICNPLQGAGIDSIPKLIQVVLVGVLKVGIPVIALAIIYSGFLFVFARGNEEKLKTAKDALFYSVIGAAILLGSWAIAEMIASTVNALK